MNGWAKLAALGVGAAGVHVTRKAMRNRTIQHGILSGDFTGVKSGKLRLAALGHSLSSEMKRHVMARSAEKFKGTGHLIGHALRNDSERHRNAVRSIGDELSRRHLAAVKAAAERKRRRGMR